MHKRSIHDTFACTAPGQYECLCGAVVLGRASAPDRCEQPQHEEALRRRKREHLAIWNGIVQRCSNPKNPQWSRYGGQGIQVSPEWKRFGDFFESLHGTIGLRPSPLHVLALLPTETVFGPRACCWSTRKRLARARKRSTWIDYFGEQRSLAEIAELHGLPINALRKRLQLGWDLKKAIDTPIRGKKNDEKRSNCSQLLRKAH